MLQTPQLIFTETSQQKIPQNSPKFHQNYYQNPKQNPPVTLLVKNFLTLPQGQGF